MTALVSDIKTQAKVILIKNRYFYAFGTGNRIKTANSLAGAELYITPETLNPVLKRLIEKGHKPTVAQIEIVRGTND